MGLYFHLFYGCLLRTENTPEVTEKLEAVCRVHGWTLYFCKTYYVVNSNSADATAITIRSAFETHGRCLILEDEEACVASENVYQLLLMCFFGYHCDIRWLCQRTLVSGTTFDINFYLEMKHCYRRQAVRAVIAWLYCNKKRSYGLYKDLVQLVGKCLLQTEYDRCWKHLK